MGGGGVEGEGGSTVGDRVGDEEEGELCVLAARQARAVSMERVLGVILPPPSCLATSKQKCCWNASLNWREKTSGGSTSCLVHSLEKSR